MTDRNLTTSPIRPGPHGPRAAFTLIELMVVVALIVLLMATALPSVTRLFRAGADAQAYNLLAAQLASARATAIQSGTYTCVHIQPADADEDLQGQRTVYMAILRMKEGSTPGQGRTFELPDDYPPPEPIPGHIGLGDVGQLGNYYQADGDSGYFTSFEGMNAREFMTIDFVFSPTGQLVRRVPGGVDGNLVRIAETCPTVSGSRPVWQRRPARAGSTAVVMFDYNWFDALDLDESADGQDAADRLNESGAFLPVNLYTGELLPRE